MTYCLKSLGFKALAINSLITWRLSIRCVIISALICTAFTTYANEVADGVYLLEDGEKSSSIRYPGGYPARLDNKLEPSQYRIDIRSTDNENDKYWIKLIRVGEYDATFEQYHAIVVDQKVYVEKGGLHQFGEFDESAAEKIAGLNGTIIVRRQHPHHRLILDFVPKYKSYELGKPILIEIQVKNIGEESIFLSPELEQNKRSAYAMICQQEGRHRISLKERRSSRMSGLVSPVKLDPGSSIVLKTENLNNWFEVTEAGRYKLLGTYLINIYPNSSMSTVVWTEHLASTFTVDVAK